MHRATYPVETTYAMSCGINIVIVSKTKHESITCEALSLHALETYLIRCGPHAKDEQLLRDQSLETDETHVQDHAHAVRPEARQAVSDEAPASRIQDDERITCKATIQSRSQALLKHGGQQHVSMRDLLANDVAAKYADGVYRFVFTSAKKKFLSATKNDMKLNGSNWNTSST